MAEVTIVRVHLEGGTGHEHITEYEWADSSQTKRTGKPDMVNWVSEGGRAWVGQGASRVAALVVRPAHGQPYLRTHADGNWGNNLLSLPRY
ncbi:DUF3892 domain-containing protein [Aeromicrobium sp. 9AM]|uniref:DUF3892 domain-containing protein n=1 Tax=Aeromicrobium sp. 9AM TaxID=2653126 RepID=UPI0012EF0C32|nr:DUF3892 domain-containing protein [Aeromicrobium sp. 9AM]VXB06079.1 conserved hypothetical protein [Aeromicrobium sp. 9AM]